MISIKVALLLPRAADSRQGVVFGRLFVTLLLWLLAKSRENSYSCHHEIFRIDRQWLWDHDVKLGRWQHPAMIAGRGLLCLTAVTYFSVGLCFNDA